MCLKSGLILPVGSGTLQSWSWDAGCLGMASFLLYSFLKDSLLLSKLVLRNSTDTLDYALDSRHCMPSLNFSTSFPNHSIPFANLFGIFADSKHPIHTIPGPIKGIKWTCPQRTLRLRNHFPEQQQWPPVKHPVSTSATTIGTNPC